MSNANIAAISRVRFALSNESAFSPAWERLNRELVRLMQARR